MDETVVDSTVNLKRRKAWLTFLLSFFAPGLGQLYNGQPKKFFIIVFYFFVLAPLSILLALMGFAGLALVAILGPCIFIFIIIEAAVSAKKLNQIQLRWYNKWYIYCTLFFLISNGILPLNYAIAKHIVLRFVHPFKVASGSMQPSIQINDRIMVDMTYNPSTQVERGDIVAFNYEPNTVYIKRVLALPGEQIQIKDKVVHVNGEPVDEPWQLNFSPNLKIIRWNEARAEYAVKSPYIVPAGKVFLLGDNRAYSLDSRYWGAVDINTIKGKVLYIFWSDNLNRIGKKIE